MLERSLWVVCACDGLKATKRTGSVSAPEDQSICLFDDLAALFHFARFLYFLQKGKLLIMTRLPGFHSFFPFLIFFFTKMCDVHSFWTVGGNGKARTFLQ